MSQYFPVPSMIVAFAVTIAFMSALRPVAHSLGLVDRPGGRKAHVGEVPIIGGIAMFVGIFVGLALIHGNPQLVGSLLLSSFLLVAIGVLDDRFVLAANVRIVIQIAAVLVMYFGSGFRVLDIGDPFGIGVITLGPFSLLITLAISLTVINAYNLVDGADGLAGSLVLIALLAISMAGGYSDPTTTVALTVAASVVGFLLFNFPAGWNLPVRSFMGDAGSTFLGFTVLWIAIGASQGESRLVSPVVCLWFASLPIYDCLTCFAKRSMSGKSPFTPGRDHFHHVLNRGTRTVRRTIVVLTLLQMIYAAVGLAGHYGGAPDVLMFVGWCVLGLFQSYIIRKLAAYKRLFRMHRERHRRVVTTTTN